jgi:hypothetical protein
MFVPVGYQTRTLNFPTITFTQSLDALLPDQMTPLLTHFDNLLSPYEPGRDKNDPLDAWTRYVAICFQIFSSFIQPTAR